MEAVEGRRASRFLALAPLLVLALPVHASAQVRLEWKFQSGEKFLIERVYTQKQVIDVKGKQYKQETTATWLHKVTVKEKTPEGAVLDIVLEEASNKQAGPPAKGGLDDRVFARMRGAAFVARLSALGRVTKLEG